MICPLSNGTKIGPFTHGGQSADVFLVYTPIEVSTINRVRVWDELNYTHVQLSCDEIASIEWTMSCCCSMEWNSPYPDIRYIIYTPDAEVACPYLPQDTFPIRTCVP